jgi:glycine/D-amino acid oxidase-like deaminating enzyme
MKHADIIVIGGGATGAACALGLAREKAGKVLMLDETPGIHRPSRANFGLTTYLLKGLNDAVYAKWAFKATQEWVEFGAQLEQDSGISLDFIRNGIGEPFLSEEEKAVRVQLTMQLKEMAEVNGYKYTAKFLDRYEFSQLNPKMELGEKVIGGMFSPDCGHVNPLFLLRAMRKVFINEGGSFLAGESVMEIIPNQSHTIIKTNNETYECKKLVVAAGHGSTRLLDRLGVKLPLYPLRGQLLVTNRQPPLLPVPLLLVRQTGEGTFMIGVSIEQAGYDVRTTVKQMNQQAKKAIEAFPIMAEFKWVRSWAAIRVMTEDDSPVYDTIPGHDNIFVLVGHSAVSLASLHSSIIPRWIISDKKTKEIEHLGLRRFNV